jgi:rod shape-determining protein MreC
LVPLSFSLRSIEMIGSITSLPKEPPRFFNRGPSAAARLTFFGVLSFALMFIDARFRTLETVRMAIATVVYPIQQVALMPGQAIDGINNFFQSRDALRKENTEIRAELLAASQAAQSSKAAQMEAERLNALLGVAKTAQTKSQASRVLYLGRDAFSQKLFINRAADQTFEAGSAVIDSNGLLGQLTRIHPLLAEVTLITEKDFVVPIKIERNGVRALLSGRGPGVLPELRFVGGNVDVVEGDVLLTSSIDGVYPSNLRVCKITSVAREVESTFSKIACAPFANLNSVETVLVLDRPAALPPRPSTDATTDVVSKKRR